MVCRDSDYRTIAGHPDFDVVSVQADVSMKGYLMLMTVMAVPKTYTYGMSRVTSLYVL